MSKLFKNVISTIGICLLTTVVMLNVLFNSTINITEDVNIQINKIIYLVELILVSGAIYLVCKLIKKNSSKIKKKYIIFGIILFIYIVLQIIWVNVRQASPLSDQEAVYRLAKTMTEDRVEEYITNTSCYGGALSTDTYFERCNQQLTLAFIWSLLFKIFNSTNFIIIEYFNIFCNLLLAVEIFLICEELQEKYKINKYLAMVLYLTFFTIPLLTTFIYGDLSGMAFAMLGVYFIMKYTREDKIRYAIYSAVLMAIAYMLRMNILIFIIAMILYLFLDLISKKDKFNILLSKTIIIVSFIIIAIIPATLIKYCLLNKYNLDKNKNYPAIGYVLIGLNDEVSVPGAYNFEIANIAYQNIEECKSIYLPMLKYRVKYLKENPYYTASFFIEKNCSMWAEPTFGAIRYNISENFAFQEIGQEKIDKYLNEINGKIMLYQKALILIIFICSILVICQNRKKLSNELILLLTIFIGGFLFHTIWEAKSRYIIPYIVVLIPIAAIEINKIKIIMPKRKSSKIERKEVN